MEEFSCGGGLGGAVVGEFDLFTSVFVTFCDDELKCSSSVCEIAMCALFTSEKVVKMTEEEGIKVNDGR